MNRYNIIRLAREAGWHDELLALPSTVPLLERFAESIIRECANVAFHNSHSWDSVDQAVKDHFGVK
jgi:hypothetical protein